MMQHVSEINTTSLPFIIFFIIKIKSLFNPVIWKNKIEEMSYLLLKAYDICALIETIPYHPDYFKEND